MTIRERIMCVLSWYPHRFGQTAAQIHKALKAKGWDTKLTSLSSQLCKMVKAGELELLEGFGPRRGNGYKLKETP